MLEMDREWMLQPLVFAPKVGTSGDSMRSYMYALRVGKLPCLYIIFWSVFPQNCRGICFFFPYSLNILLSLCVLWIDNDAH